MISASALNGHVEEGAAGGRTWPPPPHLDRGQPGTNGYHHQRYLVRDDEDDWQQR
jgi:hypothetical protein